MGKTIDPTGCAWRVVKNALAGGFAKPTKMQMPSPPALCTRNNDSEISYQYISAVRIKLIQIMVKQKGNQVSEPEHADNVNSKQKGDFDWRKVVFNLFI